MYNGNDIDIMNRLYFPFLRFNLISLAFILCLKIKFEEELKAAFEFEFEFELVE